MVIFVGSLVILAALWTLVRAARRPQAGGARPDRRLLSFGVAGLLLGVFLVLQPGLALAHLTAVPLNRHDRWTSNPPVAAGGPIHWDGNALVAELEAGSNRYAVFPVDWDANRFQAAWDVTFTQLDRAGDKIPLKEGDRTVSHPRSRQDYASVAIGLMDPAVANIDDRDHVSGSAIEACFSDDIRLRASDSNYIVRTSAYDESGKLKTDGTFRPAPSGIRIELNRKYHCQLSYDGPTSTATLNVRTADGQPVVSRRIEELKDFTNSVAWFGVSVRGYNRFDKRLDPKKGDTGYTRPKAVVKLENMEYRQP